MGKAAIVGACLAVLVLPAYALQTDTTSLGQVAKREKERRAGAPPARWTFTDADLGAASGFPAGAGVEESSPAQKPAATPAEDPREKKRADYQRQVDEQVRIKGQILKAIDDAQLELNDLRNYTFGPRRASYMQLIDDLRAKVAEIDQKVEDIQEKARRDSIALSVP